MSPEYVRPYVKSQKNDDLDAEAIAEAATRPDTRTKFGVAIAGSILVGAFFPLIALALFLVAALLVASGKEPRKTEDYLANLPRREYAIKALSQVDRWLPYQTLGSKI